MYTGACIYLIDRAKLKPIINSIIHIDQQSSPHITQFRLIAGNNSDPYNSDPHKLRKHCQPSHHTKHTINTDHTGYSNLACIYTPRLLADEYIYAFPHIKTYVSHIPLAYTIPNMPSDVNFPGSAAGPGPESIKGSLDPGSSCGLVVMNRLHNIFMTNNSSSNVSNTSSNTVYLPIFMKFICNVHITSATTNNIPPTVYELNQSVYTHTAHIISNILIIISLLIFAILILYYYYFVTSPCKPKVIKS